jgi:putative ABC transport system substrate-binding protein
VTSSGLAAVHRELIITLAARHRLPAIYSYRYFVRDGGLTSYGAPPRDLLDFRNSAQNGRPSIGRQPMCKCLG